MCIREPQTHRRPTDRPCAAPSLVRGWQHARTLPPAESAGVDGRGENWQTTTFLTNAKRGFIDEPRGLAESGLQCRLAWQPVPARLLPRSTGSAGHPLSERPRPNHQQRGSHNAEKPRAWRGDEMSCAHEQHAGATERCKGGSGTLAEDSRETARPWPRAGSARSAGHTAARFHFFSARRTRLRMMRRRPG